jgi:hypothetical protein
VVPSPCLPKALFTVEAEADIIFSKEINSIAADTVKFIPPIGDFVFLSFFFCDSLPHTQRRSPGSVGSRACTSPQSQKSDGPKGSDSPDNLENVILQESDAVSNNSSQIVNSDSVFNSSSDLPKLEPESEVKMLNSSISLCNASTSETGVLPADFLTLLHKLLSNVSIAS